MFLRISAYLCVHPTQNPLAGSSQATQSFIWRGPEWWRSSLLLMPSVINGLRSSVRENQAGGRIEPLSCLANRFLKKIKSPVACSREVAIPMHRPHPWHHHALEAN